MQVERSDAENAYVAAFDAAKQALPAAGWHEPAREKARARLADNGLPHRRMEAWRWTDLRSVLDGEFPPALKQSEGDVSSLADVSAFSTLDRHVIVFVDGHMRADLSSFDGLTDQVEFVRLGDDLEAAPEWLQQHMGQAFPDLEDTLSDLNTAFLTDGVAVSVPGGVNVEKPVELVYINTGSKPETLNTRCLVVVGEGAEVTILETHSGSGDGRYVSNGWTEFHLAQGAKAHHVKVQDEGAGSVHLANLHGVIGADAELRTFCLNAGAETVRNQIKVRLDGEGGHTSIASAYLLGGQQHCDTALLVDHAVPRCTSNELFKCVMDDHARGIFQGKIIVRPDAQQTDGMQMSQGLLLSETAEFDAKPELEIFADDVRCTHGATSGELDEEPLFYLRSRGVPEDQARALLIGAFVGEAIEEVASEDLQDHLKAYVAKLRGIPSEDAE